MSDEDTAGVLAGAHSCWKALNLAQLLRELDAAGETIVTNQKTSVQERRKLAERTKEFRTIPDATKATEFKPLLRAYQREIDELTKRMKYAENEFLRVFKALSDAPDPEPFLAQLLASSRNERELEESRRMAEKAEREAESLRSELRASEEARRRAARVEADMERVVEERVREIRTEEAALARHLKEREADLQRQLSAAQRQLAEAQTVRDSEEQLAQLDTARDRELVTAVAELEIVQSDLERANVRISELQTQNARLRVAGQDADRVAEYRARVEELEDETQRLFDNLQQADTASELLRQQAAEAQATGEQERKDTDDELARLRKKVRGMADYDEIRRDLDILKSIELSGWGMDDDSDGEEEEEEDGGGGPLEKQLVRRNKSLENRLTDTRNRLTTNEEELATRNSRIEELETSLQQKQALAERLEADLLSVNNSATPATSSTDAMEMQPLSSVLEVVTGQRDRFRQRNIELEDEMRAHSATLSGLRQKMDQSEQDNLRLYEEIKYLRNYTRTDGGGSSSDAIVNIPSKFSARVDVDTTVAAKYKGMYEESLNPFNAFHRRESSRRVRSMGLVDRLIYMLSNFVIGNRRARMLMLLYLVLLHLLVLGTLYRSLLAADGSSSPVRVPVDEQ
ncbi:hypothetical protein GGF46_002401 [Coemansia sp. RSA 552]|nr:hypothetical protein GGF46_002401 [Coemansia sp. RSA 552]